MALQQYIKPLQHEYDSHSMYTFIDRGIIAYCIHLFYSDSSLFPLHPRPSCMYNPALADGAGILALAVQLSLLWIQKCCTIAVKWLLCVCFDRVHAKLTQTRPDTSPRAKYFYLAPRQYHMFRR